MDDNTCENPRIREEQEQEHEYRGTGYGPGGGEQNETGRAIDGSGKLVVVLVEHGDEPC